MAPSNGKKYQILGKKGLRATPKPLFFWQPPTLKKVEKNPKRSGQLQHPNGHVIFATTQGPCLLIAARKGLRRKQELSPSTDFEKDVKAEAIMLNVMHSFWS